MKRIAFLILAALWPLFLCAAHADESPNFERGVQSASYSRSGGDLVSAARQYIGRNPTGKRDLWCQDFVNFILKKEGYKTTGSRSALQTVHYGNRTRLKENTIAVLKRPGGGHTGFVSGILGNGYIKLVSGNSCKRNGRSTVCEGIYPLNRAIAFVEPQV